MSTQRLYTNPVLTGFFPDPSIIRVGADYYMANSTFEYFPGVVISHSRDLVHWEIIGHAITNNKDLDLTGINDSHGLWAPDISYYQGTYYIFVTLRLNDTCGTERRKIVHRQMIVKSSRPEGPYSKPVFIDHKGIDPSHFVDDDGTHYMLLSPGATLFKLNADCTKVESGPVTIWPGTGERCPEGPHLFKHNGFYYAVLAEGGTGYGHRISVARSQSLYGPYEPSPYNPVMQQTDPTAPLQRTGHGKLVQTQNGDWWIVYLCGRSNGGHFTTLGRETALDPVQWTEDGWFTINNGKGPSITQTAPALLEVPYQEQFLDDFDGEQLALHWQFVRNPEPEGWSLTARPGHLRLLTGNGSLGSLEARNILVRREKHFQYSATTKLDFSPVYQGEEAGLVCYHGRHCFIKLYLTYDDGLKVKVVQNRNDEVDCLGERELPAGPLYLKVTVNGQQRDFYYSCDQDTWELLGSVPDASFLSNEGVKIGKHHTGTMVGIYAVNGGSGARLPADFDWFDYSF